MPDSYRMSYERAKLVLSGGLLSRSFFSEIYELAGTDTPIVAVDTSPRVTQEDYDSTRAAWAKAFSNLGLPDPLWMQEGVDDALTQDRVRSFLDRADVLLVTGGGTKQAFERWQAAGVTGEILARVKEGDVVAAGGSAGAMIWFSRGFSDSMQYGAPESTFWEYIVTPGAALFPSWVTAHHGDTDDLGRSRRQGFMNALGEHDGEWNTAVGIDTNAALVCFRGIIRVRNVTVSGQLGDGKVYLYSPTATVPRMLSDGDTIATSELT